jgi:hypothetical protein
VAANGTEIVFHTPFPSAVFVSRVFVERMYTLVSSVAISRTEEISNFDKSTGCQFPVHGSWHIYTDDPLNPQANPYDEEETLVSSPGILDHVSTEDNCVDRVLFMSCVV